MERIAVVTDSVAVIPERLQKDLDIHIVPFSVEIDGQVYQDGIDFAPDDFYHRLQSAQSRPTTSQPSPGVYLQVFEQLAARADRILCLTLSARYSGAYASALTAAGIFADDAPPGRPRPEVRVVDSKQAAVSQGWVAIEAARAVKGGASWADVLRRAEEVSSRTRLLVVVDTVDYLVRGGHVPKLAGAATTALGVKPMVEFTTGGAAPAGVARSIEHAFELILKRMTQDCRKAGREGPSRGPGAAPLLHVGVMHAGARERGESLLALVRERLDPIEAFLTDFTPVMGVHTGPGLAGVGYYVENAGAGLAPGAIK